MTDWKEYSVHINKEAEESVAEILIELGSAGVSVIDRDDFETMPEYGFDALWALDEEKFPAEGVVVKGYFSSQELRPGLEKIVRHRLESLKKLNLNVEQYTMEVATIVDSEWENKWKEYYYPVPVTRYLTIVPEWENYIKKQADEQLIILDPGLAFGTGTHPTTQLSIQALEIVLRGGETVFDVGTGSGVLTIASSLLGATEVHAFDLDEMAVQAAKNNLQLNKISAAVTVKENNLLKNVTINADIVVANILANIILDLIPDAMRTLKPGGYFISSGIIKKQAAEVVEALKKAEFKVRQINQIADWIVIIAQKPGEI